MRGTGYQPFGSRGQWIGTGCARGKKTRWMRSQRRLGIDKYCTVPKQPCNGDTLQGILGRDMDGHLGSYSTAGVWPAPVDRKRGRWRGRDGLGLVPRWSSHPFSSSFMIYPSPRERRCKPPPLNNFFFPSLLVCFDERKKYPVIHFLLAYCMYSNIP